MKDIRKKYDICDLYVDNNPFFKTKKDTTKGNKRDKKICKSIKKAIKRSGLKDGMTISFHHAFRGGDKVLNLVMDVIANMGIKDLTLCASSLTSIHDELIKHIENGVVTQIYTSGLRSKLGEAISYGLMKKPVQIHSHGGRVHLIKTGEINIDVAFLGVSTTDNFGNATGSRGRDVCGSLGYAKIDAQYAKYVVLLTEELVEYPNKPSSISQDEVDAIVQIDEVGDPSKIGEGATRLTKNPKELLIARNTAKLIVNSGLFKNGFSLQTGTGGASIATASFLAKKMRQMGIKASFAIGGITSTMVKMHEEGLIKKLLDVQSFDAFAAKSLARNPNHIEISANEYANFSSKGASIQQLDIVILSALEIDLEFNVNVMTGSKGIIRGASGGHSDTADEAKLAIIVAPLTRGRIATVTDRVNTVITPGSTVDVLVTDQGIAVNPRNGWLIEKLQKAGMKLVSIDMLYKQAMALCGTPKQIEYKNRPVGIIRYRDGSVIDVIRELKS